MRLSGFLISAGEQKKGRLRKNSGFPDGMHVRIRLILGAKRLNTRSRTARGSWRGVRGAKRLHLCTPALFTSLRSVRLCPEGVNRVPLAHSTSRWSKIDCYHLRPCYTSVCPPPSGYTFRDFATPDHILPVIVRFIFGILFHFRTLLFIPYLVLFLYNFHLWHFIV